MPKIIENVKKQLLEEARKQITEYGYGATTIRSVAKACGIAVGTVYNYFPSKEMLIASFVAEDWYQCMAGFSAPASDTPREIFWQIYQLLRSFTKEHHALFTDADAVKTFSASFSQRHKQLRDQIAKLLLPVCPEGEKEFLSQFLAEALLTWTMAEVPFETLYPVLEKLSMKK